MYNSDQQSLYIAPNVDEFEQQIDRVSTTLEENEGNWMTLAQIGELANVVSDSSVASRIRDLRVEGQTIERRRHPNTGGTVRIFEYRLLSIDAVAYAIDAVAYASHNAN